MAGHIEARSLSSLNHLAANPPQYPNNPAEEKHEPLVLYLSRVPGSRGSFPPFPIRKEKRGILVPDGVHASHI